MKLYIAKREAAAPGGAAYMVVDEAGERLPCQLSVNISQSAGEASTVTVTFLVDGKRVLIGEPPPHWMDKSLRLADKAHAHISRMCSEAMLRIEFPGSRILANCERVIHGVCH